MLLEARIQDKGRLPHCQNSIQRPLPGAFFAISLSPSLSAIQREIENPKLLLQNETIVISSRRITCIMAFHIDIDTFTLTFSTMPIMESVHGYVNIQKVFHYLSFMFQK